MTVYSVLQLGPSTKLDTYAMIWAAPRTPANLPAAKETVSVSETNNEHPGFGTTAMAVLTDLHFLIPLVVLVVGIALLIALH